MEVIFADHFEIVQLKLLFDYIIGGDWGKEPDTPILDYSNALCIRGSEFRNWNNDKGKTASLRNVKLSNIKSRQLQEGDILIEISGGGPDQPVGRTVLIDKQVLGFKPDIPKICTNFIRLARPSKYIFPNYLQYYLTYFYKTGEVVKYQGGSNNLRNLKFDDYVSIEIPLPPLAEQHRIVAKLEELFSELDKGIESLKTAQQQLKVYRQAVLKYAFEGKLTNPNVKEGELPEGWVVRKLIELCDVNPRLPLKDYSEDLEVTFLPMKNVSEIINKINTTEKRKYSEVRKGFTPMIDGDVIFAKITPCMENGKLAVVHSLLNGIAFGSTEFHVFRTKLGVLNTYIFYFLIQEQTRRSAEENMTGAVGQRRVPKKFLEELLIPLPKTIEKQELIVQEIESRLSVCDKIEEGIEQGLKQAEALRQSILKKAFEGKLVAQNPSDEPASVLLERIRKDRATTQTAPKTRTKKVKA